MNDEMKEKLSAYLDNESHDENLLSELLSSDSAQATLTHYQVISDVMRNRYAHGAMDLAGRVSLALQQEATIVTPKRWFTKPRVVQQAAGLAVAATVAAVSVFVVGDFSASPVDGNRLAVVEPITDQPIKMTSAVQKKLNGYLVSHNEFSASGKMQGILPYSRIARMPSNERLVVQTGAKIEK